MNIDSIHKRLPSNCLFRSEWIESLNEPATRNLLHKLGLDDTVDDETDLDDLRDILFAFISSYNGHGVEVFHRIFELLLVFPNLDFELVQSLLESTEGKLSSGMIEEFIDLSAEMDGGHCEHSNSISISAMTVSRVIDDSTPLLFDRKTVLIISDDDCDMSCNEGVPRQVMGVATSYSYGLNAVYSIQEDSCLTTKRKYMEWGMYDFHVCHRAAAAAGSTTGEREVGGEILMTTTRPIYFTSVVFEYSLCLERVIDMFHYGWSNVKGAVEVATWTPALEEAMLHLLIAVDDDLVVLVR